MPRQWNKTEAFGHFGVPLENARWSWSGVSEDGATVALVLWQDGIKGKGGQLTYRDDEELEAEWRNRIGARRRIEHLKHSVEHLGGKFRAVIAKAVDPEADPRQIEKCFPQEGLWWKIETFDPSTGAFKAQIVRN